MNMRESSIYREVYAAGIAASVALFAPSGTVHDKRDAVLWLGTKKFGEPDDVTRSRLAQIESETQIDWLVILVHYASSWNHLLDNLPTDTGSVTTLAYKWYIDAEAR
ncbi:MAG: hypothetical protein ACLQVD_14750 [Capsulimonadaceae bacterium]